MTDGDSPSSGPAGGDHEFVTTLEVRFRDIDVLGHVNNAVYASYLEQARYRYFRDVHGRTLEDTGIVLASLEIDYRRPITEDEEVTVGLSVVSVGTSSLTMAYTVSTGGTVSAEAETVQVVLDEAGDPAPVPDAWRERFTRV